MFKRFRQHADSEQTDDILALKADPSKSLPAVAVSPPAAPIKSEINGNDIIPKWTKIKIDMHGQLLDLLDYSAIDKISAAELEVQVRQIVGQLIVAERLPLTSTERDKLREEIVHEVIGLGPLEPLIKDSSVTDILVNTSEKVFVERGGKLQLTEARFYDERHLMRIIQKIVAGVGRRVDESSPMVDARLPDGSRVNAVVPPVAVDGALLSIRKFSKDPYTMGTMIGFGSLTKEMAHTLGQAVKGKLNVLVSGGTGSGKTTMLNALSAYIGHEERIVTVEDAAELQLQQEHVARLETRPPNVEGRGEIRMRDLVKNALRMRPNRIIVGEVRAGEAFDMMQAMNTGHEGSMTTVHANSPRDALSRLEQMIGMAEIDIPTASVRAQMASALDIIVQMQRLSDGRRRMVNVSEVTGMEGSVVQMQEIFTFVRKGLTPDGDIIGEYQATGILPRFVSRLAPHGIEFDHSIFTPGKILGAYDD